MTRRWNVGDRVVWPHYEHAGRGSKLVRSIGTITALDEPGLPKGARVQFDEPVLGSDTCYATRGELERLA